MNNLIRMLLGLTCALTMAACDAVSVGVTPDFETKGEVRLAKEQAVEDRAKPTGLILESFTCGEPRGGGYHGTATFKNEGKTLTDVRMRLTALAGDKIELDYTTGVPQDIPNGATVQLSAGSVRTDPSHIKYCGIEVKENRKKVFGGDLKDISFSSGLLTLPVSFVSRFAEKQTIAAPKPWVHKEQAVEDRAIPTGLILESFTCREPRGGGYAGTATFKNEGKTLTDVSMRLIALAGDKIELDYTTGVRQDIPNGATVQLSAGRHTDPSHIKYCGIEVKEIRNKVFFGDLNYSFSSGLLTLPVSFVSRFAEKQTIAAPKPSVYEDDATKDDTGRTALRSGTVWQNKFTEYENNCDEAFLGQLLGLPNWEVRKAPNGIRYWSCEGPEGGAGGDETLYFGALWEALEGQYGSIKCLGDMIIDWEVQKGSGEPQIESVNTVRCYQKE